MYFKLFYRSPLSLSDRTDWSSPDQPVMAPYTLYTGLSLGITFKAFLSLFLLHLLLVIVLKIHTSEIIKKAGRFEILRHCLENMNIPIPFEDFDVGKGCIKDYRRRRKNVIIEMSSLMTLNLIFNFLMMTPLIYTGQLRNKLKHIRSLIFLFVNFLCRI